MTKCDKCGTTVDRGYALFRIHALRPGTPLLGDEPWRCWECLQKPQTDTDTLDPVVLDIVTLLGGAK